MHYALSYVISSRVVDRKSSFLIALAGLLPDIDALFGFHRWVTHSAVLAAAAWLPLIAFAYAKKKSRVLTLSALATLLYIMHIILDVFTSPTPLLWPLTSRAYAIAVDVEGAVTNTGLAPNVSVRIVSEAADFSRKHVVEGPIATPLGIATSIAVFIAMLVELFRSSKH